MTSLPKIALAADHRGYAVKEQIKEILKKLDYPFVDCGTFSDQQADYPDFMLDAAEKVSSGLCARAIGICHSGIGSTIVANKVHGVRAALVHSPEQAVLSRAHNDSNMLILGSGYLKNKELPEIIEKWLTTPFEGGRHERRVHKIQKYEDDHS